MVEYNLERGQGKTTRAVILSEYFNYPILVKNRCHKKLVEQRATELNAKIPEPIIAEERNLRGINRNIKFIIEEKTLVSYYELPENIAKNVEIAF